MNLPNILNAELENKRIIIRADLDIENTNNPRFESLINAIKLILEKKAQQIVIISHKGRPEGLDEKFSLNIFTKFISEVINEDVFFAKNFEEIGNQKIILFENLRFWKEEEENNEDFAKNFFNLADVYINESFAVSHRKHASLFALPNLFKKTHKEIYFGERFIKEINVFENLISNAQKPFLSILSGIKKDKLDYLDSFINFSDKVVVAGRLPEFLDENYFNEKVFVTKLIQDKEDITIHSIEEIEKEIQNAQTILVSGPIGKFEEEGHLLGTKRVFEKIAQSSAYCVAGGGDTEEALKMLKLEDKFDWISVGGGAMLEFLSKKTLPAIEAVMD